MDYGFCIVVFYERVKSKGICEYVFIIGGKVEG